MVIDVHYHPAFFEEACGSEELAEKRRDSMAYYKTPRASVERIFERMTSSGVDRCFLIILPRTGTGFPMRKCLLL